MGCQIHPSNPQILCKLNQKEPTHLPTFSSMFKPKLRTRGAITALSANSPGEEQVISAVPETYSYNVEFKTLGDCKLGISKYPDFVYNAEGGKGTGTGKKVMNKDFNGDTSVDFDVKTLYIPPLTTATTKFLGLPLPPFLRIDIVPEILRGSINQESGTVDLNFKARFWFSVGSVYRAPPLLVETLLTSEESKGTLRSGKGERLDEQGRCILVGVAVVDPITDFLLNSFLGLPTECLAKLNAIISFSSI